MNTQISTAMAPPEQCGELRTGWPLAEWIAKRAGVTAQDVAEARAKAGKPIPGTIDRPSEHRVVLDPAIEAVRARVRRSLDAHTKRRPSLAPRAAESEAGAPEGEHIARARRFLGPLAS